MPTKIIREMTILPSSEKRLSPPPPLSLKWKITENVFALSNGKWNGNTIYTFNVCGLHSTLCSLYFLRLSLHFSSSLCFGRSNSYHFCATLALSERSESQTYPSLAAVYLFQLFGILRTACCRSIGIISKKPIRLKGLSLIYVLLH